LEIFMVTIHQLQSVPKWKDMTATVDFWDKIISFRDKEAKQLIYMSWRAVNAKFLTPSKESLSKVVYVVL
jgi:hypothetical protein